MMFPILKFPFKLLLGVALGGLLIIILSGPFVPLLQGLVAIYLHPSLLITDYLAVGGLHATLVNVWLVTWTAILLLYRLKVNFSGVAFAGVMTILAFSFFGKNLLNILPVWFGFYLYTKMKGTVLSQYTGTFLFSTGIAPITSFIIFGIPNLPLAVALPLGILAGMLAGWLTPMVVSVVGKFHQGYNLYNTGFGLGFISMIFAAILRAFGVNLNVPLVLETSHHAFLFFLTLGVSMVLILSSFFLHRQVYRPWLRLISSPGNLPTDFYKEFGLAASMFNVAIIGLFSLSLVSFFNFQISGPVVGGIYTFMGFGVYGKHVRNAIPVISGLVLASFIPGFSLTNIDPELAVFFVTALAPIGGKFGFFYGVLAGSLHLMVLPHALALQGGFDLYNNGFAGGLVAGVIVVIAQQFPMGNLLQFRKKAKLRN